MSTIYYPPYSRGQSAFFTNDSVLESIVDLASASKLVIYCGAGVTIDRTGRGWGDLIFGLFTPILGSNWTNRLSQEQVVELRKALTPLELASVYQQYVENSADSGATARDRKNKPISRLQEMLYANAGWESGVLVRNVVRLASGLTLMGKNVEVLTSNYDVYLENEYEKYQKELSLSGVATIPGLEVRCAGQPKPHRRLKPHGGAASVYLTYLHGRIPRLGGPRGRVVLSERDYVETRETVVSELTRSLQSSSAMILGSSLTDPPLLEALQQTRPKDNHRRRIAVLPASSTGLIRTGEASFGDFPALSVHHSQRMLQFGVTQVVADFHFQIAQYCQEILTCVEIGPDFRSYAGSSPKSTHRYGERLVSWWREWSQSTRAKDYEGLSTDLRAALAVLEAFDGWGRDHDEVFKLEMWVRFDPARSRKLALWAGSSGVLRDRTTIKTDELDLNTRNASVRAFIEGRPLWLSRKDLGRPETNSRKREWISSIEGRWDQYLAIPIRLERDAASHLSVGVITLASMGGKGGAGYETNVPINNVAAMEKIIDRLQQTGRTLLIN